MAFELRTARRSPWLTRVAIAVAIGLVIVLLTREEVLGIRVLQRLELATLDYRFQFRGTRPMPRDSSHVVIVEISDDSFRSLPENFPWPRSYYAHLVRNLRAAGARAVGIDLLFTDRDAYSDSNDNDFRSAIRQTGAVVLAGKREQDNTLYVRTSSQEDYGNIFYGTDSALGLVNVRADADGIYRFYNPYFLLNAADGGEFALPTFGFAVLNKYLGFAPTTVATDAGSEFLYAGAALPKYDPASVLINFYGPNGTFPHVKFHDVIDDSAFTTVDEAATGEQINTFSDPDFGYLYDGTFRDKIVLVGVTGPEYKDLFPVAIARGEQRGDNMMYGVEVHANVVESVLRNDFLRVQSPAGEILLVLALVIGTFLVTAIFRGSGNRKQLLVEINTFLFVALELASLIAAALLLFTHAGYVMPVVGPVLAVLGGYAGSTVYNLFTERKQRVLIRNMFSTYVNPSVVDSLIADPDKLVLGGERKELTVLFSDIEGFTTISQRLSPEELVTILNEYLDVMTGIVFKHDGTVDKYEGDAVMAFWGAPIPQEDHALRACLSALEMQEAVSSLNDAWIRQGRPRLRIRIGINTGDMVVGNMGASGKFAYTVIGDSVNVASRLEGANKEFATGIMVSERTYALVQEVILGRELDSIIVKGRTEPVTTFELIQKRDRALDPGLGAFLAVYNEGMEMYRAGQWKEARVTFERALLLRPDDTPTRLHAARSGDFETAPPDVATGSALRLQRK